MTILEVVALVVTALQELETKGVIKIGGYDPNVVNQILATIEGVVAKIFSGPSPGGQPKDSTPGTNLPTGA